MLPGLRRESHGRRLVLSGLDAGGVAAMVADLAEQTPPPEFVDALVAETLGNPFFVREVALHLVEEGRVRPGDGTWVTGPLEALEIPEGVREVIGRRLSRLSADANRLLGVAAAFEAGFNVIDSAAVAGLDEDRALDAVEEALAAGIVKAGDGFDRYEFSHALFRHTLWSEWSPSRQVRLHRAIAEQLEKRDGGTDDKERALVLARQYHLSLALPGAERGVPHALAAADQAAARFAASEEYLALSMALDLLLDGDSRAGVLHERAAQAAILSGERMNEALEHARVAIEEADLGNGPVDAVHVAIRLGLLAGRAELHAGWAFGHLAARYVASLDEASREAVQLLGWDLEEAEFLDPDNPGIMVDSPARRRMNALAESLPPGDRPQEYLPSSAETSWEYLRSHRDNRWWGYVRIGRYRQAAEALRDLADEALRSGLVGLALHCLGNLGRLFVVLGELDRAAETQTEGERYLPRVDPNSNAAAQFGALAVFWQILAGEDPASPLAMMDHMLGGADRPDLRWVSGPIRLGRAPLLAALGRKDEAMNVVIENLPVIERAPVGAPNFEMALHWAARAAWLTEYTPVTATLEHNLRTKVIEPGFCYTEMDSHWDAALLAALGGRPEEARDWFRQSYDRVIQQEAVTLLPHIACDEAVTELRLGSRGDRDNARRRLEEGHQVAERVGLAQLIERIDRLRADLEH